MEEQAVIDFYRYPPVGREDWRYAFATAKVRAMETFMLSRGMLLDMTGAASFESALEQLAGSDYAAATTLRNIGEVERMLIEKREQLRTFFIEMMLDDDLVELLRARHDFANMRLAIRRLLTDRPIGLDYSNFGSVPAEEFEDVFEQEDYSRFPYYLQEAVEAAVLGYYIDRDVRRIDYAIDAAEAKYRIGKAKELRSEFLLSLFRIRIDLTNIRTMLRLKVADRIERDLFLQGGFVGLERFIHGLDVGYEALGPLFFVTPYFDVVGGGVSYLSNEQSFLRLERLCEEYLMEWLKLTHLLAAGPQPVISYFLRKENEIRAVRMVLTCKNNGLDTKLILDRLGE